MLVIGLFIVNLLGSDSCCGAGDGVDLAPLPRNASARDVLIRYGVNLGSHVEAPPGLEASALSRFNSLSRQNTSHSKTLLGGICASTGDIVEAILYYLDAINLGGSGLTTHIGLFLEDLEAVDRVDQINLDAAVITLFALAEAQGEPDAASARQDRLSRASDAVRRRVITIAAA
jgi:hypothetical protein